MCHVHNNNIQYAWNRQVSICMCMCQCVRALQHATNSNDDYGNGNRCAVCVLHAEINDGMLVRTVLKKRNSSLKKKNSLFKKIVQKQKFLKWKKRQNGSFCFACKKLRSQIFQSAKIVAWKVGGSKKIRWWREGQTSVSVYCVLGPWVHAHLLVPDNCQRNEKRKLWNYIYYISFSSKLCQCFHKQSGKFCKIKAMAILNIQQS